MSLRYATPELPIDIDADTLPPLASFHAFYAAGDVSHEMPFSVCLLRSLSASWRRRAMRRFLHIAYAAVTRPFTEAELITRRYTRCFHAGD